MDQRFLSGFLFTCILVHVLSHVRGICISKGVSFLNGTLGDDVLFQLGRKVGNDTRNIVWNVKSKNQRLLVIQPGENRTTWNNSQKEYEGRLSVASDWSLILMNVTSEDSGCYESNIMSTSGHIDIQSFNLTVFETVSTKSSMSPWMWSLVFIPVVFGGLVVLVCVCLQKKWKYLNKIKGRRTISIVPKPREVRRAEEEWALVLKTSLPDQETQMRTAGDLPATTTRDNEGVMLARVCTPQESSPKGSSPETWSKDISLDTAGNLSTDVPLLCASP